MPVPSKAEVRRRLRSSVGGEMFLSVMRLRSRIKVTGRFQATTAGTRCGAHDAILAVAIVRLIPKLDPNRDGHRA